MASDCSDSCHGADIILLTTFLKRMQSESLNLEIQYSLIDRQRPTPKVREMKPSKASFGKISKTKTFKNLVTTMHDKYTLDDWLNWQESLMEETIVLGLDRVQVVYDRLFPKGVPYKAVSYTHLTLPTKA